MKGHQGPSALQSVEGVHPLPPQIREHQIWMDTPLQVRRQTTGIGAEDAGGVGKGSGWHPHIFASLHGYPGKWAHMLDEGEDISVQDLPMHMERTFGNKRDYDAIIRTLYEVQQRDDEMVEEYMLCIHEAVVIIC